MAIDQPCHPVEDGPDGVEGISNFVGLAGQYVFQDRGLILTAYNHHEMRGGSQDVVCKCYPGFSGVHKVDDTDTSIGIKEGVGVIEE